jgi:hypothetical protein
MAISSLIPVGAWLWDKYGKSITDRAAYGLKDRWDKYKWDDAAEKYRAKLMKLCGTVQIMGMIEPKSLDEMFVSMYVLDKPTALGRFDVERLTKLFPDANVLPTAERKDALRLVSAKDNLFLIGKPGAGKTTLLKYITLKAAEQIINKVPIFISLKEWSDSGLELIPFMTERFDICDFPAAQPFVEELLKSGNAIVLFDGLDEVNQEDGQRERQVRAITSFIEKYDQTKCLITCRIGASDYSFKPFSYVELSDFTKKDIDEFVKLWFRKDEERGEHTGARFLAEFEKDENKGLRELARTPLLLTLLCLAFNETLTFPQRRVEIYEEALDALLKKWDSSRRIKRDEVYRKLSLGHKENMLARIAAETFEKNEYFISRPKLEKLIVDYIKNVPPHEASESTDGEVILKAIEAQHGIFVERAHGIYSFSHLTFQEYFTAKYIVANATEGTLTNLVREHRTDGRWREVFLLVTSLLPDARQLMGALRNAVDELLGGDETLRELLEWTCKKSASIQAEPWLVRPNYLLTECYYSQTSELNTAFDPFLDSNFTRTLDILDFDLDLTLHLPVDFIMAREAEPDDLGPIPNNWHLFNKAIDQIRNRADRLGLDRFARELAALSVPAHSDPDDDWVEFDVNLRGLITEHRHIGYDWDLTPKQEFALADFLNATRLLQDCLGLAFMPPDEKNAMLRSLFLPPLKEGRSP